MRNWYHFEIKRDITLISQVISLRPKSLVISLWNHKLSRFETTSGITSDQSDITQKSQAISLWYHKWYHSGQIACEITVMPCKVSDPLRPKSLVISVWYHARFQTQSKSDITLTWQVISLRPKSLVISLWYHRQVQFETTSDVTFDQSGSTQKSQVISLWYHKWFHSGANSLVISLWYNARFQIQSKSDITLQSKAISLS